MNPSSPSSTAINRLSRCNFITNSRVEDPIPKTRACFVLGSKSPSLSRKKRMGEKANCELFNEYGSIWIGSSFIAGYTNSNQPSTSNYRLDKVTFGTNWIAQAEQGGFYQAMSTTGCAYATGIYKDYDLDVTIKIQDFKSLKRYVKIDSDRVKGAINAL